MQASKWLAFPILTLQFINTGLLAPTLPDIIVPFFGNSYPESSLVMGIVDSIGAFTAFLISPLFGSLSDRYGRKPFLFLTVLLTALQVWCIALYPTISLWYYLVCKAIGKISVYGPVLAYIADCTSMQDRAPAFGQATASIFVALTGGPIISMFTTPETSFHIACVCTIVNCSYILFILPETVTDSAWNNMVRKVRGPFSINAPRLPIEVPDVNTLASTPHWTNYGAMRNGNNDEDATPQSHRHGLRASHSDSGLTPGVAFGRSVSLNNNSAVSASADLPVTSTSLSRTRSEKKTTSALPVISETSSHVDTHSSSASASTSDSVSVSVSDRTPSRSHHSQQAPSHSHSHAHARSQTPQTERDRLLPQPPARRSYNPMHTLRFVLRHKLYTTVTLLVFFSQLSEYGIFETEPLYLKGQLAFERDDRSHVMVVTGVCTFIVMTVLMPWLLNRFQERHVLLVALSCNLVHALLYTCVWEKWHVFIIAIVGSVGFMSYPSASSLLSKNCAPSEQGIAQGALSGFKSLTQGFGPLLFSIVFSFFSSTQPPYYLPQAPFFLGAMFIAAALVFTLWLPARKSQGYEPHTGVIGHHTHTPQSHAHTRTHPHGSARKLSDGDVPTHTGTLREAKTNAHTQAQSVDTVAEAKTSANPRNSPPRKVDVDVIRGNDAPADTTQTQPQAQAQQPSTAVLDFSQPPPDADPLVEARLDAHDRGLPTPTASAHASLSSSSTTDSVLPSAPTSTDEHEHADTETSPLLSSKTT